MAETQWAKDNLISTGNAVVDKLLKDLLAGPRRMTGDLQATSPAYGEYDPPTQIDVVLGKAERKVVPLRATIRNKFDHSGSPDFVAGTVVQFYCYDVAADEAVTIGDPIDMTGESLMKEIDFPDAPAIPADSFFGVLTTVPSEETVTMAFDLDVKADL